MADDSNSVLFSLKELKRIEDERLEKEAREAKEREDAQRQSQETARRAAEAAEAVRRKAEAERLRKEEEDRLRREQEARIRQAEAEHRARVDAELASHKAKLAQEIHAEVAARKLPWGWVIGGIVALALIVGGIGFAMFEKDRQRKAAAKQLEDTLAAMTQLQNEVAQSRQRFAEQTAKMEAERLQLENDLRTAPDDARRAEIQRRIAEQARREEALRAAKAEESRRLREKKEGLKRAGKATSDPIGNIDF